MLIFILERTIELDLPLQSLKVQNMSYPKALFFLQKSRLQQLCLHRSTPGSVLTWMELGEGKGKRRHRKCGADEGSSGLWSKRHYHFPKEGILWCLFSYHKRHLNISLRIAATHFPRGSPVLISSITILQFRADFLHPLQNSKSKTVWISLVLWCCILLSTGQKVSNITIILLHSLHSYLERKFLITKSSFSLHCSLLV